MRNMLHPVASVTVSEGDSRQPVPHSSLGPQRTQANRPWAAAKCLQTSCLFFRSCAPLHLRKPKWTVWPVSTKCCDLLMSDHLCCSLVVPIRPSSAAGATALHSSVQLYPLWHPQSRQGSACYRHSCQASHSVVRRQPPQSRAAPAHQADKLINLLNWCTLALGLGFCRSCHRLRMSVMKPSRILSGISPPECSSTSDQMLLLLLLQSLNM